MQSIKSDWSFTKEKAIINLLSSSGRCLLSFIRWYTKKQLEKGRNVNKWLQKEITLLDIKLLCLAKFYFIFLHDTLLSLHDSLKKLLLTSVLIAKWIVSFVYFLTWNSSAVDFTEYFKEKKTIPSFIPSLWLWDSLIWAWPRRAIASAFIFTSVWVSVSGLTCWLLHFLAGAL